MKRETMGAWKWINTALLAAAAFFGLRSLAAGDAWSDDRPRFAHATPLAGLHCPAWLDTGKLDGQTVLRLRFTGKQCHNAIRGARLLDPIGQAHPLKGHAHAFQVALPAGFSAGALNIQYWDRAPLEIPLASQRPQLSN